MAKEEKPRVEATEIVIEDGAREPQITIKTKVTLLDIYHKLESVKEAQDNFSNTIKCVKENVENICGMVNEHERLIADQAEFCLNKQVEAEQEDTHTQKFNSGYEKGEANQLKRIKEFIWFMTKILAIVTALAFIFSWVIGLWG